MKLQIYWEEGHYYIEPAIENPRYGASKPVDVPDALFERYEEAKRVFLDAQRAVLESAPDWFERIDDAESKARWEAERAESRRLYEAEKVEWAGIKGLHEEDSELNRLLMEEP